ncbi:alpha/beta hydrolase-fold protein [Colwellia sp. 1_MG-2023]|uniref:alpha/beta hydrolase n=1 Tax=Colwellia sp. 1_MG-2023 TaxID=3062649 RepID=UPI0026E1DF8E|nr:alpha/beta hydrolase-fold protein [Colwellia sp. 1_MG-2023]MDO6445721.1 alpha/beta hydrolase-fold protein [Colwellia sp. 1_MG-2023]
MKRFILTSILIAIVNNTKSVHASGFLSTNYLFKSEILKYDLNYRVYTPKTDIQKVLLPTLYLTDGQWYLSSGEIITVLDDLIASNQISPIYVIFIDSRNPHNLIENRRNNEFMCNSKYISFFINELVPTISYNFPVSLAREDRVIGGISFGGLNAACFGLTANKYFGGLVMQSPANEQHLKIIRRLYAKSPALPLKMFLSSGGKNDNGQAIYKFYNTLLHKNYDVTFIKNNKGHNWDNWRPLIPAILTTFFTIKEISK